MYYTDMFGRTIELDVFDIEDTRNWASEEEEEIGYVDRADAQEAYEEFMEEWN